MAEYWLQQKLRRIWKLGFLRATVSYQGEYWELSAMTRGDVYSLAQGHRLRQVLREGYDYGATVVAGSGG